MSHPLSDMMQGTMQKIREMVDVNTVVGDPISTPDGVTIIPVSKVSFGFGGGGSDFNGKNQPQNTPNPFGGGVGAGVTITPISFLIVKGESVRMLPVSEPATNSLDRVLEMIPDLIDRITALLKKDKTAEI